MPSPDNTAKPEPWQKKAMTATIFAQCWGNLCLVLWSNGFLVNYLKKLHFSSDFIILFLSLPGFVLFIAQLPLAHLADCYGKKLLGWIGIVIATIGLFLIALTPQLNELFDSNAKLPIIITGGILFWFGQTLTNSGWFPLLKPLVPEKIRGRFFAKLRISFQTVNIIFSTLIITLITYRSDFLIFQAILLFTALGTLIRLYFYIQIPETEKSTATKISSFGKVLAEVWSNGAYVSFCCYIFLLSLFTGTAPSILALLQKDILHFSEQQIVITGNSLILGSLAGFYIGGKIVDWIGTKYVFLACHLGYATSLTLVLIREIPLHAGIPFIVWMSFTSALFGFCMAASGIASTSETIAMTPKKNQSVFTSVSIALGAGGWGLSGFAVAQGVKLKLFAENWTLWGMHLSQYDTILLICTILILAITVTLGLVPSVNKAAALPYRMWQQS